MVGVCTESRFGEFASRFQNDELPRAALDSSRTALGLIDEIVKLLRNSAVTEPCFVRRSLHGDGQKFSVVAFNVAPQQRYHVTGDAHLR